MQKNPQRTLNSAFKDQIGRDGAPKRIVDAPIKPGMKRATSGDLAAYHHGISVSDEPNVPLAREQTIPLHPSTPKRIADQVHPIANSATAILKDAQRLGKPKA